MIGVGSPFGDDRVGWEVVAALDAALRAEPLVTGSVRTRACDRPAAGLIALLQGAAQAVVVDAARWPGCTPGNLRWLCPAQCEPIDGISSHGFGVGEALALARVLGQAPPHVHVLAIAVAQFAGDDLSEPVRAAVPSAVRSIRALLSESAGAPVSAPGD